MKSVKQASATAAKSTRERTVEADTRLNVKTRFI
jgi:hypothetical protein